MKDKNQIKQLLKFVKPKNKLMNDSPLKYELPKKTELTEKQIGKYGVLSNEKFERDEGGER